MKQLKRAVVLQSMILCLGAPISAQKVDKVIDVIHQTWDAAPKKKQLDGNAKFIADLKKVLARKNQSSIDIANKYATYLFMNGMKSDVENLYNNLPESLKNSSSANELIGRIYSLTPLNIGSAVPDFTAKTPEGKDVNLKRFLKQHKCVILDFWASWCGWCRKESPNVIKTYNAFKEKGLGVLSFSFDNNRDRWTKAIAEDNTPWTQVSDLLGTNDSPIYSWYGLNGIPAIFLLDSEGRIIRKDMRGDVIYNSVETYLSK